MYNETYAPILSVIERNFVQGDAAHGGGVALDAILGANTQELHPHHQTIAHYVGAGRACWHDPSFGQERL
jgi:hypothetical protein